MKNYNSPIIYSMCPSASAEGKKGQSQELSNLLQGGWPMISLRRNIPLKLRFKGRGK